MMRRTLAAAVLAGVAALPLSASAQNDGKMRIVGHAAVEIAPNFVVVRVGVSSKAPSPTAALDQNSAVARKIIDFSKTFGVEARDIQTDAVILSPVTKSVREPNGNFRQEPDGYTANNTVQVRLSDLSRLGLFMRQVVDQGATNINGVQFGSSDAEKATDEARQKAVDDAVRQARLLADAAKVKLGKIQAIVHPLRAEIVRVGPGVADMGVRRARPSAVPIEAGTLQITADVEITWAIE
jgi:uncharacterized protein YggE